MLIVLRGQRVFFARPWALLMLPLVSHSIPAHSLILPLLIVLAVAHSDLELHLDRYGHKAFTTLCFLLSLLVLQQFLGRGTATFNCVNKEAAARLVRAGDDGLKLITSDDVADLGSKAG